jgi:hypothetical protein
MPDVDALWQAGMGGMVVTSAAIAAQGAPTHSCEHAQCSHEWPKFIVVHGARNPDRLLHRRWAPTVWVKQLTVPTGAWLGHPVGHDGQGLPARNRSCPLPRDSIVANQWETASQFAGG